MAGLLGHETYEVAVTVDEANIAYTKDSATVKVNEDTAAPVNNLALPIGLFFYDDGVQVPVTIDSVTPANNKLLPASISGPVKVEGAVSGNIAEINADSEALTNDVKLLAYMAARLTRQAAATSSSVVLSTEDNVIQDAIKTAVESLLTNQRLAEVDSYFSSGTILTTGTNIGTTVGTVKKINVHSQIGEPLSISIGGTVVCIILAGGGGDFDCSGLTGAVVVTSLTSDTTGDIAVNLMG